MTTPTSCKPCCRCMPSVKSKLVSLLKFTSNFYYTCSAAHTLSGKSISLVRRALLERAIRNGEPYARISDCVKDSIEFALLSKQTAFLQKIQDIFDSVVKDFDEMFVVEEIPDPRRDALCLQIQDFVAKANARLNGPIELEFAAATSLAPS